jgi:hypothetical protein
MWRIIAGRQPEQMNMQAVYVISHLRAIHCSWRRTMAILFVLAAWLVPLNGAHAATTVRVLETWPSGEDVTLTRNQSFYLRLAHDTDKPVGIWIAPYFHGEKVNVGSSPSPRYSGSGEALAWFFFFQPGDEVDEIRIKAGDGGTNSTPVVATWRGHVVAGSESASTQDQPEWVSEMNARAKAAQDRASREQMSKPASAGDVALLNGFMLTMLVAGLAGIAAPAWGMWRWRGGWRLAAAVPAVMIAFVILRIVIGASIDPTSHNLWPFEILMVSGLSLAVMAALKLARKWFGAGG